MSSPVQDSSLANLISSVFGTYFLLVFGNFPSESDLFGVAGAGRFPDAVEIRVKLNSQTLEPPSSFSIRFTVPVQVEPQLRFL